MKRIYFDNAATTPLNKSVAKAMAGFEAKFFGNPSSVHNEGQEARAQIDFARAVLADFFHSKPQEIIFTSGATESNNLAVQGTVAHYLGLFNMKPHVITTKLEHHSVYNLIKKLQDKGVVEASFVNPDKNGNISAESVIKEIRENTVLISMIFVSNEIGSVLPIREVGGYLENYNLTNRHKIMFHCDAVQAVKFYNCHVVKLGVDLLSFSAHKINGPKGIGGLYVRAGTQLENIMSGGAQEYDLRPGTQNTPGIIGMAKAYEQLGSLDERQDAGNGITKLKQLLVEGLKKISKIEFNGTVEGSAPDILSFTVVGQDQDSLIARLDLAGFAVSTGSACVSGSSKPSHVIEALGKVRQEDSATVRVSLSKDNTAAEINALISFFSQNA